MTIYENKTSINKQWRCFFDGENHRLISNILASIFNDFLKTALKYKIVLDTAENHQILKQIDKDDISHTAKLADTFFETKFFNRSGNKIRCTLNSGLKKFQRESSITLNIGEIDKLKLDIHKCGQFENISKILLQARNTNAHWHAPIEDSGNAALVSGAILRLLELFELESFQANDLERIRNIAIQLILSIGIFETNDLVENETLSETEISEPISNDVELEEKKFEEEDIEEEIELPDIHKNPINTKEQKRQILMKLSYDLLSDKRLQNFNLKRQDTILSRQTIKEFLEFDDFNYDILLSSLTVSFLLKQNNDSIKKQIEYYGQQIIQILSNNENASN